MTTTPDPSRPVLDVGASQSTTPELSPMASPSSSPAAPPVISIDEFKVESGHFRIVEPSQQSVDGGPSNAKTHTVDELLQELSSVGIHAELSGQNSSESLNAEKLSKNLAESHPLLKTGEYLSHQQVIFFIAISHHAAVISTGTVIIVIRQSSSSLAHRLSPLAFASRFAIVNSSLPKKHNSSWTWDPPYILGDHDFGRWWMGGADPPRSRLPDKNPLSSG